MPDGKYQVIYADPPWPETNRSNKKMACALDSFPTMPIEDIMALPVGDLADENAVLYLWSTFRHLWQGWKQTGPRSSHRRPCAFDVLEAWGFRFVTVGFVWVKTYRDGRPVCGPGYHTHSNAEPCLLGVKGSAKAMFPESRELQIVQTVRRQTDPLARKPNEVRFRLERMYPQARKLELFARTRHVGWDAWGNEIEEPSVNLEVLR